ncbi:hypothetical protein HF263_30615 [Rhizobium leguminosarum]|uniref:hypothetical protein n=1 Tax=Rhizobium leguminosarum TaxID=384 RepID=UPI001C8FE882|nr:hypothetical protein [Rhizobium leguminosarum]MBY3060362.1 hypothetical protein [Rhizobium leguminosarum]
MGKDIDLLAQLAAFARANDIPLTDPNIADRFAADMTPRLRAAIKDRNLVYGMRTERLFEAMVVSLGKFRLFKIEDNGVVHGGEQFRAPDFRVVTDAGQQWLIEVKNVHRVDPFDQFDDQASAYMASLRRYSDAVGVPLLLAHFWSRWGMWTLVEVDRFLTEEGGLKVEMAKAFAYSRLGDLGDVAINLPGPLEFTVRFEPTSGEADQRPTAALYRAGQLLTDARDQNLAMILLQFGQWPLTGPVETRSDDGARLVRFTAEPEEPSDQGFDGIGLASRIFSRFYREDTSAGDQVTQLNGEARPDWFRPLAQWDFTRSKLGLRIFRIQARMHDFAPEDENG